MPYFRISIFTMNNIRLFIAAISILLIQGCSRVDCLDGSVILEYSGFDSTELSMVVIKRYNTSSGSIILQSTDTIPLNRGGEKNGLQYGANSVYIYEGPIWAISLPLASRTDVISDIKHHHNKQTVGFAGVRDQCTNEVSYTLNGEGYSVPKKIRSDYAMPAEIIIKK